MIDNQLLRLLILAASADVPASEIRDFVETAKKLHSRDVVNAYIRVHTRLRQLRAQGFDRQLNFDVGVRGSRETLRRDMTDLMRQSGVPPAEAAERIREVLISRPDVDIDRLAEYNSKDGFGRWVDRIANSVGASTLLNVAVSVLAKTKIQGPRRWRLSKP